MRTLVAGWYSFEHMGASAGDLMARDVVCDWLRELERPFDIALAPPFEGGVDWRVVDPGRYSEVVFVCGPFGNGGPLPEFLAKFDHAKLVGVNLTMLDPLEDWNPFDLLLERDSSRGARPDISVLAPDKDVPVVGVVLIDTQPEYGDRDRHVGANREIRELLDRREVATVSIDTRLDDNKTGLRTPAEVATLISRMDVVLTTRLHGLVLSLRGGVPPVAIDSVAGGGKIERQAETLGWPYVLSVDSLTPARLEEAFDRCLTEEVQHLARECSEKIQRHATMTRDEFLDGFPRLKP